MIEIINNDCLIVLRGMADNSIDAVVTDPPYGLSFMNKHWDYDVPSVDIWREVLRVLKPGGHLLSFGGTRTYHRMVVNIEDAGFEIRDQIQWIYGSGFPKSLNIGKAVDGLQGNEREVLGVKKKLHISTNATNEGWKRPSHYNEDGSAKNEMIITQGNSPWEGYGTALKPANEPICLARKPISEKSIAENVLKWGTGGLNIDGCRVEYHGDTDSRTFGGNWKTDKAAKNVYKGGYAGNNQEVSPQGRFPANVIHDGSEEVLKSFPNGGAIAPVASGKNGKSRGIYGDYAEKGDDGATFYGDNGSVARFFYCAKASKTERGRGLDVDRNNHPTVKPVALMRYLCRLITPPKGIVLDPFVGSGSTGIGAKTEGFSFIGIEREKEYCDIARARINAWTEEKTILPQEFKVTELTLWNL